MARRLLLLADVVEAADVVADFAVLVLHSAHHQADREQVAILVQAALFAHPELLGRYRLAHILFQVIAIVGGPEPDDMLADHLIIGKTGDAGKELLTLRMIPCDPSPAGRRGC